MDGATHFIVPYAAALLALGAWRGAAPAQRTTWAIAFGIGGWAPDFDVTTDWLSERFDALYWLQHRGFSHSLIGAPVHAGVVLLLLALLSGLWAPLRRFAWSWRTLAAATLGSVTHLLLDGITYGGVPLWWPLASGRVMFPLFHWLVFWLFPFGAVAILLHAFWRRMDRRAMLAVGAAFVLVLAGVAAARWMERPSVPAGGHVYSRSAHDEWVVLAPREGGWDAVLLHDGAPIGNRSYVALEPAAAAGAVAAARATDAYRGFQMGLFGPEVVQARPRPEGGWNVTFLAVAQRFEAEMGIRWSPAKDDAQWGLALFHVDAGGAVAPIVRGW